MCVEVIFATKTDDNTERGQLVSNLKRRFHWIDLLSLDRRATDIRLFLLEPVDLLSGRRPPGPSYDVSPGHFVLAAPEGHWHRGVAPTWRCSKHDAGPDGSAAVGTDSDVPGFKLERVMVHNLTVIWKNNTLGTA